jgi:hypothetical protein
MVELSLSSATFMVILYTILLKRQLTTLKIENLSRGKEQGKISIKPIH